MKNNNANPYHMLWELGEEEIEQVREELKIALPNRTDFVRGCRFILREKRRERDDAAFAEVIQKVKARRNVSPE